MERIRTACTWTALCVSFLAATAQGQSAQSLTKPWEKSARGPLIMDRGSDEQEVYFPRDEQLEYSVTLDLGLLGEHEVGRVNMNSRVIPFYPEGADPMQIDDDHELEQAIVSARALGSYNVYTLDETILTEFLPQAFPRLLHKSIQSGTENRRRELSIGTRDGVPTVSYRGDGHCKGCKDDAHFIAPTFFWNDRVHCKGCNRAEHRLWKDPKSREVPANGVDMVTAVMLARTVVQQGKAGAQFPLVDRDKIWDVQIKRGKRERHKIGAGTFDVVEVVLVTRMSKAEKEKEQFSGLFGLHGNISIWMHPESGVPVEITGTLPAGPLELDVQIALESYRGTPPSFRKVVK